MSTMGKRIAQYRRKLDLTQDTLAGKLGVSNQAVSKWESDQCYPDIMLLPKLADIFSVSLDELFGRDPSGTAETALPWPNDDTVHAVVFKGHTLWKDCHTAKEIHLVIAGPSLRNVESQFGVSCDEVHGNVTAGGDVTCGAVYGDVSANGDVSCDNITGFTRAGGDIDCDQILGDTEAGGDISCDQILGNAKAGGDIQIG